MTCELVLYDQKPVGGKSSERAWPKCGKPVFYVWKSRFRSAAMNLCKECGEEMAGNFTDELTPVSKERSEQP